MIEILPIKVKKDKYYKYLKTIYDINVVQTHRCIPDKLPKGDYKLCIVMGSSGNGKTSTLRMFEENTDKWYYSFEKLIEDLNKSSMENTPKILDEFGSNNDKTSKYYMATLLQNSLYTNSRVVISCNDRSVLKYLTPDWVFDVDSCDVLKHSNKKVVKGKNIKVKKCTGLKVPNNKFNVGLIVGRDNTGKDEIVKKYKTIADKFKDGKHILEQIGGKPVDAVQLVNSVGLKSVMTWLTPYEYLSTGQKARASLIPYLTTKGSSILCVKNYGDTVDPDTQCSMAYTFGNAIRKLDKKVIIVSNNEDIIQFLKPDWVLNTNTCKLKKYKNHQKIKLKIIIRQLKSVEASKTWGLYKHYHYLSHSHIPNSSFGIFIENKYINEGKPLKVGIMSLNCTAAWSLSNSVKNMRFAHRFVISPSFQGMRLGGQIPNIIGDLLASNGLCFKFITSHKSLINQFEKSDNWVQYNKPKSGANSVTEKGKYGKTRHNLRKDRVRYFFEYRGPKTFTKKFNKKLVSCKEFGCKPNSKCIEVYKTIII